MKIVKLLLKIICGLVALVITVLIALNVAKFVIYSDYYQMKDNYCINPGLNHGAVPQGIAVDEERDIVLTSAYMKDNTASRIYVTNSKNKVHITELTQNGKAFKGHVGGISLSKDDVFIADGSKIYKLKLDDVMNEDYVEIGDGITVNNQAQFTFADDNYLYVGEFNYADHYVCENEIGDYKAICTKYSLDDLTTPVAIYSIRDKVQGFCVTDKGDIVLSTSWSVANSYFYVYRSENIKQEGEYKGTPLYILDNEDLTIKAPAMSEDLSFSNGKVYTMFESACDKYIFGKFFFANKVVGFEI